MTEDEDPSNEHTEEETVEAILKTENTAAAILRRLKTQHDSQASNLPWMKDVVGVVATLGSVEDDNLSRFV